ncbi:TetR/AcrR family transcriptional regulator [Nocardiopsis sediminis]|uniref:TetR/AcrR family transcriptional regulator n=1 Tax=Nocardiopsis sediminis TaxID=1778267 RepID=A0ABV8FLD6_9ACTN
MTAQPPERPMTARERNERKRRARILKVAAALAARGGLEHVHMRDVADRADVALATLYRYYPSKTHLLVAVLADEIHSLEEAIVRRPVEGATPGERAATVLGRTARWIMREPDLADAMLRAANSADASVVDWRSAVQERLTWVVLYSAYGAEAADSPDPATRILARALHEVWTQELVLLLHGSGTVAELEETIAVIAPRLLDDPAPAA